MVLLLRQWTHVKKSTVFCPNSATMAEGKRNPVFVSCKGYSTTLAERCFKQMEIKKSKFIAVASHVASERAALDFLNELFWRYYSWMLLIQKPYGQVQNTYRFNDDGEPGGTAGKPIYSSIVATGLDYIMVVVTRYYGGIKLGTGGLVRAYGGVSLDCLKEAKTIVLKPEMEVYKVSKLQEEYDMTKKGGTCMTVMVEEDKASDFENAVQNACRGQADIKRL